MARSADLQPELPHTRAGFARSRTGRLRALLPLTVPQAKHDLITKETNWAMCYDQNGKATSDTFTLDAGQPGK